MAGITPHSAAQSLLLLYYGGEDNACIYAVHLMSANHIEIHRMHPVSVKFASKR